MSFKVIDRHYTRLLRKWNTWRDPRYQTNNIDRFVQLGRAVLEGDVSIGAGVRFSGNITIGAYSTIDMHSVIHGGGIHIGRYTQIGPHVGIYALNHAIEYVTMYNNSRLFDGRLKLLTEVETTILGSDVWIGYGATILPGVVIGNGAVVGAGAVVSKDLPDFAVAVGNPAKVIKMRFSDEIIELLSQWEWWKLDPSALIPYEEAFKVNLKGDEERAKNLLNKIVRG